MPKLLYYDQTMTQEGLPVWYVDAPGHPAHGDRLVDSGYGPDEGAFVAALYDLPEDTEIRRAEG